MRLLYESQEVLYTVYPQDFFCIDTQHSDISIETHFFMFRTIIVLHVWYLRYAKLKFEGVIVFIPADSILQLEVTQPFQLPYNHPLKKVTSWIAHVGGESPPSQS